jgi:hypothetical protein
VRTDSKLLEQDRLHLWQSKPQSRNQACILNNRVLIFTAKPKNPALANLKPTIVPLVKKPKIEEPPRPRVGGKTIPVSKPVTVIQPEVASTGIKLLILAVLTFVRTSSFDFER